MVKSRLHEFGLHVFQSKKDKDEERKDRHHESFLSDWKRKIFSTWLLYGFGGIYDGIDLFNQVTSIQKKYKKNQY